MTRPLNGSVGEEGMKMAKQTYRGWEIYPTDPVPPIPGWQAHAWTFCHKDYDGPEDGRCGTAASIHACREEIDEREGGWLLNQPTNADEAGRLLREAVSAARAHIPGFHIDQIVDTALRGAHQQTHAAL